MDMCTEKHVSSNVCTAAWAEQHRTRQNQKKVKTVRIKPKSRPLPGVERPRVRRVVVVLSQHASTTAPAQGAGLREQAR